MPSARFDETLRSGNLHFRVTFLALAIVTTLAGCDKEPMLAGNEEMKRGNYTSAIIEFKNAVQSNPASLEARLALADALEHTYDTIGAEQELRKAIESGGDAETLVPRIALLLMDRNEMGKVISQFRDRRLKSPEGDSNLRAIVSTAYVAQRQLAAAHEQLIGAVAKTPTVILAKAQLQLAENKKAEAMAELGNLHGDRNRPWWEVRALARLQEAAGNHEKSLELMKLTYDIAPWHRGVVGEYGEFLVSSGKLEEAKAMRAKLQKLAPAFYWTHYLDALILAREHHTEGSQAAALKVLAVAPEHLPAILLVASAELQKGDVMMASTRLKKAAMQHPYSIPTNQLLAEAQLRLGKTAEASEALKRALSAAPNNPRLLSLRADSEAMRGANKDAAATLGQLITRDPSNASYLLRLSEIQARQGYKEEAAKLLDQATAAGKDNPLIRDRIVSIALATQNATRVRQLADYALGSKPQDPQSHLLLAAALGIQNDSAGAWQATLAALDLNPAFQPALTGLTFMAREQYQRDELLARYEKAILARSTTPQTYLEYARLLHESKKDRTSITKALAQGVGVIPASATVREALIDEHLRNGNRDAALSLAQSGASANDATPDAVAVLGATYAKLDDRRQAMEIYRKLATNYPQRPDWRLLLADFEAAADHKKEATTILRSLMADRPFDPAAYIKLANLTVTDNLSEALSIARELGEREANRLTAMLLEGDLLLQAGKTDDALKQFSKATKAGAVPAAMLRTIQLLDNTDRRAAADVELTETLRKFSEDPAVLGFAGQRLRAQGKLEKATELLQKVVNINPENPFALNDLAWAQIEAKQPAALKNASKAADILPNNPNILDTLGLAQAQAGKYNESVSTLQAAVNLAPRVPEYRIHLAEQLAAAGDTKAAARSLDNIDHKHLGRKNMEALNLLQAQLGLQAKR